MIWPSGWICTTDLNKDGCQTPTVHKRNWMTNEMKMKYQGSHLYSDVDMSSLLNPQHTVMYRNIHVQQSVVIRNICANTRSLHASCDLAGCEWSAKQGVCSVYSTCHKQEAPVHTHTQDSLTLIFSAIIPGSSHIDSTKNTCTGGKRPVRNRSRSFVFDFFLNNKWIKANNHHTLYPFSLAKLRMTSLRSVVVLVASNTLKRHKGGDWFCLQQWGQQMSNYSM